MGSYKHNWKHLRHGVGRLEIAIARGRRSYWYIKWYLVAIWSTVGLIPVHSLLSNNGNCCLGIFILFLLVLRQSSKIWCHFLFIGTKTETSGDRVVSHWRRWCHVDVSLLGRFDSSRLLYLISFFGNVARIFQAITVRRGSCQTVY